MPSTYLASGDYSNYGAPAATTPAQVQAASVLIDAYLKRPEGLVWSPDGNKNPAFMAALSPQLTYAYTPAIAAGENVVIPLNPGFGTLTVGEVLILDRANSEIVEAVVVVSIVGPNVTLRCVQFDHSGPCTLDKGMVIKQHKFMPDGRPITTLAYTPVARLLSGQGRYGYGRRGDSSKYMVDEFNLLASLSHFGGPPVWESFPLETTGVDPETGQVWVPAGVMLAYYSEINLWYVAGFPSTAIPDAIKFAAVQLIIATQSVPVAGNLKSFKAGDTQLQFFSASLLNDDTKAQLAPYRAKLYS